MPGGFEEGWIILYPTDTIWVLAVMPRNEMQLKKFIIEK
jgi:tRNA A37 threonylcarbamoyladenosine synthetase subunit TsaC/SUA5/YrdC